MDTRLRYILIFCLLCGVYSVPLPDQDRRVKRNSDKITDLRSKLSRLQDILQQIQKEDPGSENVKKDVKSNIKPEEKKTENDARAMIHTESEMGNTKKTQIPKLTPDEAELLQALKFTLEKEREDRQKNDLERLKSQKAENTDISSADKNADSGTHKFLDHQLNDKNSKNSEMEEELKSYVQPKEGRFGSFQEGGKNQPYSENSKEEKYRIFRQKVLRALEQRLLEDINIALSHGFSLEEILQDLQRADDAANIEEMEAIEKKLSELRRSRD